MTDRQCTKCGKQLRSDCGPETCSACRRHDKALCRDCGEPRDGNAARSGAFCAACRERRKAAGVCLRGASGLSVADVEARVARMAALAAQHLPLFERVAELAPPEPSGESHYERRGHGMEHRVRELIGLHQCGRALRE